MDHATLTGMANKTKLFKVYYTVVGYPHSWYDTDIIGNEIDAERRAQQMKKNSPLVDKVRVIEVN